MYIIILYYIISYVDIIYLYYIKYIIDLACSIKF